MLYLDEDFTWRAWRRCGPMARGSRMGRCRSRKRAVAPGSEGGQIFGNAGANDTMAGRCPYEEIAEWANVMLRTVGGNGRTGGGGAARMKVEIADGAVEVRLGDGLSARLTAQGQQSGVAMPRHAPWNDTAYEHMCGRSRPENSARWPWRWDAVTLTGSWPWRRTYGALPVRRKKRSCSLSRRLLI